MAKPMAWLLLVVACLLPVQNVLAAWPGVYSTMPVAQDSGLAPEHCPDMRMQGHPSGHMATHATEQHAVSKCCPDGCQMHHASGSAGASGCMGHCIGQGAAAPPPALAGTVTTPVDGLRFGDEVLALLPSHHTPLPRPPAAA